MNINEKKLNLFIEKNKRKYYENIINGYCWKI